MPKRLKKKKIKVSMNAFNDIEHQEFIKKRKEHYKNEVNAKMLLK